MSVCRDSWGRLAYTATNSKKDVFSVTKGENYIVKHLPYMRTDARRDIGLPIGEDLPRFESFIQAAIYLKRNVEKLC